MPHSPDQPGYQRGRSKTANFAELRNKEAPPSYPSPNAVDMLAKKPRTPLTRKNNGIKTLSGRLLHPRDCAASLMNCLL